MGKLDKHRLGLRIDVDDPNRQEISPRSLIKEVSLDSNEMSATAEINKAGNYLRRTQSCGDAGATDLCHRESPP
jgi:hypothetical protein